MVLQGFEVVFRSWGTRTESQLWVGLQQMVDDIDTFRFELVGNRQLAVTDFFEHFVVELTSERHFTNATLVNDASKSPQVTCWATHIV